jgi:hypothetical protein
VKNYKLGGVMADVNGNEVVDGAWIYDAQNSADPLNQTFVETPEISEFLRRDSIFCLVAPKGMGKTLVLQRKSQLIRESANNALFFPQFELIEKFDRLGVDFSEGTLAQFSTPGMWKTLWATAIATTVIYRSHLSLPNAYAKALGVTEQLSEPPDLRAPRTVESFLLQLLNERYVVYKDIYPVTLKPLLGTLDQNAYVFLDSIDEAFEKHAGYALRSYERVRGKSTMVFSSFNERQEAELESDEDESDFDQGAHQGGALSEKVWISAQLGLLAAQRDLHNASRRVRVYSGLRKEAIDASRSSLSMQETELYRELSCTKVLAEQIFEANIARMHPSRLVAPDADSLIERFFGYSRIEHRDILDRQGLPVLEPIFDYLYRHTFGRPREIVMLGSKLVSSDRKQTTLRKIVEETGYQFYKFYKQEMIPFWDGRYNALLKTLHTNVVSERSAFSSFNRLRVEAPSLSHPFSKFINRGLIGFVRRENGGVAKIAFKPPGGYRTSPFNLGRSSHYFVHPCLQLAVARLNNEFCADNRQIVAPGNVVTLGEESGLFRVTHVAINHFHFTFDLADLPRLNNMRSRSALIFACLVCAVGRYALARVSWEDVARVARQCTHAGLISLQAADGISLEREIENFFGSGTNLSAAARASLDTINGALVESQAFCLNIDFQHVDDEAFDKDQLPVQWDGTHFNLALCAPEKVDAMFILRKLEENAEQA